MLQQSYNFKHRAPIDASTEAFFSIVGIFDIYNEKRN